MDKYQKIIRWFAETYYYPADNDYERERAEAWLKEWKRNLMFKLSKETYEANLIEEKYIHRESKYVGSLAEYECLSLKICVEIEFFNELKF